jgi:hypothetical protein
MLKKLCQSLGLASLILVINYGDLLGGGADVRMHTPFPLAPVCYAHIADVLLLALLLFLLLTAFARTRFYPWLRLLLAIVLPPYLLQRTQSINSFDLIEGLVALFLVLWTAVVLLLLLRFDKWYRRLMRTGSFVTSGLVLFALAIIAQLLWVAAWKPASNQITAAWNQPAAASQPPRQHPLLVWIVFDELSYDQLFEHRAPNLALPNFDALRAQSTLFTNTQSIGIHTVKVLPSLLTGRQIDAVRYSFHNRLWVHHADGSGRQLVDGPSSVFGDAVQSGWRTAAVGWYNPYCSAYAPSIQNCYWTDHDMQDGPISQRATLAANIASPLHQLAVELVSPARADRDLCNYDLRLRHLTQIDLQQHALQILRTDQADFVFLHLSIPHSPNTWSRAQNAFTSQCGSSYLDNLALTDRVLGQILATLQASPRWSQTTLIVQGDHGWRSAIWRGLPAWTAEDEQASRGLFDPRPALLIHQPAQSQPQTVATPWPILQVHSVVEQILHHHPPTL